MLKNAVTLNYLAHLFLSGPDPDLQFGNFIADGVRSVQLKLYPAQIQAGIRLHHKIDAFTDSHPVVAESKERLRPMVQKYAGVVVDMFYDHFLAKQFQEYSSLSLAAFADQSYALLLAQPDLLPARVQRFLPYMIKQNWLVGYAQVAGISGALNGLSRRAAFESGMDTAGQELIRNYDLYQAEFNRFFPELQAYIVEQI